MKITKTDIPDLFIIEPRIFDDERGYFFESYHKTKFKKMGIRAVFVQDNQARSTYGVIRGLHFQRVPYAQAKLVRVIHGKIFDVAVDLRQNSASYGKWYGIELSAENKKQLFVPRGFAHGYSVISETAEVLYKVDNIYHPEAEGGINYRDPELNIDWKIPDGEEKITVKDEILPKINKADINF